MIYLTWKSILNRRLTALLTIFSIAVSAALVLGVEKVRTGARTSFASTLSDTDLIVGARTGPVQLLLYSVFRIGNATNNIRWQSYQLLKENPEIKHTIPISLGDSHRGYKVLGTNDSYFRHFRYGKKRPLQFAEGRAFNGVFETVVGSDVAKKLQYNVGDKITLSHGISETSFQDHKDKPFTIVGILKPTATPVDRTVHVSLEAIEAIHIDWQDGAPPRPGQSVTAAEIHQHDLTPKSITAFLVKLNSKIGIFSLRREINIFEGEPLLAILPGATLSEFWQTMAVAETALSAVSFFVVVAGLLGMLAAIYTSLNERRREMAILRSLGARSWQIFLLLIFEAQLTAVAGCIGGVILLYGNLFLFHGAIVQNFGLDLTIAMLSLREAGYLLLILAAASVIGIIPAWRAYRNSLADGLTIRL